MVGIRSNGAGVQSSVAVTLTLSIVGSALGLVGRYTINAGGSAGVVLGNTASGSTSGRVLGSNSANESERSNSGELHICGGSVVMRSLENIKRYSLVLCIANVEVGLISRLNDRGCV